MDLYKKALAVKPVRSGKFRPIQPGELELYVAYMKGVLTLNQVLETTGHKSVHALIPRIHYVFRTALQTSLIEITLTKKAK
jgi:hypothetical protein